MKNLSGRTHALTILVGGAALAVALSGCGGSSRCTADLTVSWNVDGNGTCEGVGATSVDFIVDGVSHPFPCNGYGATITNIPIGSHTAQLQLHDAAGVISDTGQMTIGLNSCRLYDLNGGTEIQFDTNQTCTADLQASWVIDEAGTGASLTCQQVPATTVEIILDGTSYPSACTDYTGRINNIPLGTHRAQLRLLDGATVVSDTGEMSISLSSCILYDLNGGTPIPFTVN